MERRRALNVTAWLRREGVRRVVTLTFMIAAGWGLAIWFFYAYMMNGSDCGRYTPC